MHFFPRRLCFVLCPLLACSYAELELCFGSSFWSNHIATWYLFWNGKYSYQGPCFCTTSTLLSCSSVLGHATCFSLALYFVLGGFAERCLCLLASLRILRAGWVCIVWCFPLHLLQTNLVSAICLLLYSVFMPWYAFLTRCASVLSLLVNTFVWEVPSPPAPRAFSALRKFVLVSPTHDYCLIQRLVP